jgi:hypothetical protein
MREALEAYKAKANNHLQKLQEAEAKMAKLSRKETTSQYVVEVMNSYLMFRSAANDRGFGASSERASDGENIAGIQPPNG